MRVHSREQAPIGPTLQPVEHVPPPWFLTTSAVYSAHRPAGLLHPAAGQGSSRFGSGGAGPVRRRWRTSEPPPRDAGSHPSKGVLVDSRCRITAVRCHLVVTGAHPIVTAAEAALRVGPGEPGAAGSKTRPKPNQRPAGMGRRLVYDEAPIRRERRTPTSPGHADTGEPATNMRGPPLPTAPKRRLRASGRVPGEAACLHGAKRQTSRAMPESILREPSSDRSRKTTPCTPEITEVTRADPSRRREQPTSGLYSVDESVVSIAVAGESTPDPSMGFVPLQGPLALRSSLVHARTGERRRAEARDALDAGPVFEADASTVGIPPTIAPRNPRRPTRGWNDAEVRDEPGGRSRLRATRLFSAPSEARDRAPHPLVRPKPSSRAGKCRRSLSGGEVVSPWTAMHSAAAVAARRR